MVVLDQVVFGNTALAWIIAIGVALLATVALPVIKRIIVTRLHAWARKTETNVDDLVIAALDRSHFLFFLVVGIWVGSLTLALPERSVKGLRSVVIVALVAQGAIWLNAFLSEWLQTQRERRKEADPGSVTSLGVLGWALRVLLWTTVLLLVLDNVGIDITALVAGLGIGGLAIALAVQNVLGDLFASLSIVLDKPFVVGDGISVGEFSGTVEKIGIKTTRIRSVEGEHVVISNSDLLSSRIRNYQRMTDRRVLFTLGVVYRTPPEKLERIPGLIREIIESQPDVRFDRVHFTAYGESSLLVEVVFHVTSADYGLYLDRRQAVNLAILRRFAEEEIEFAYPSQTVYVEGSTTEVVSTTGEGTRTGQGSTIGKRSTTGKNEAGTES